MIQLVALTLLFPDFLHTTVGVDLEGYLSTHETLREVSTGYYTQGEEEEREVSRKWIESTKLERK
jgi:hypothetical protein